MWQICTFCCSCPEECGASKGFDSGSKMVVILPTWISGYSHFGTCDQDGAHKCLQVLVETVYCYSTQYICRPVNFQGQIYQEHLQLPQGVRHFPLFAAKYFITWWGICLFVHAAENQSPPSPSPCAVTLSLRATCMPAGELAPNRFNQAEQVSGGRIDYLQHLALQAKGLSMGLTTPAYKNLPVTQMTTGNTTTMDSSVDSSQPAVWPPTTGCQQRERESTWAKS